MKTLNAADARATLFMLLDEVAQSHEPVLLVGKRANAVLMSENHWRSIQDTVFLLGIAGMRESIVEGLNTSLDDCADEVE